MKSVLFITSFFLAAISAWGQTKACEVDVRIKGVGTGTPYATVIRKLGTPLEQKREAVPASSTCSGEAETYLTLKYSGLEIVCIGNAKGRKAIVNSIVITSSKWQIHPLIKIGFTKQELEAKLGKRGHYENQALFYCTKDNLGTVKFVFEKNKLIKISLSETLC
ncbi:MAG TPA: hypothetical protein VFZ34_03270 [Blastocatellia bacterium]|nr:hypothetical protein [Blastocatellia bacterium]